MCGSIPGVIRRSILCVIPLFCASHANPVWAIRELTQKEGKKRTNDGLVANASISVIGYENGEFFEIRPNITEHLGELVTVLPDLETI